MSESSTKLSAGGNMDASERSWLVTAFTWPACTAVSMNIRAEAQPSDLFSGGHRGRRLYTSSRDGKKQRKITFDSKRSALRPTAAEKGASPAAESLRSLSLRTPGCNQSLQAQTR